MNKFLIGLVLVNTFLVVSCEYTTVKDYKSSSGSQDNNNAINVLYKQNIQPQYDNINQIIDINDSFKIKLHDYKANLEYTYQHKLVGDKEIYFDYIYSEDIESAIPKINLFSDNNYGFLFYPSSTEEYPTFSITPYSKNKMEDEYTIEMKSHKCFDFNKIEVKGNKVTNIYKQDLRCDFEIITNTLNKNFSKALIEEDVKNYNSKSSKPLDSEGYSISQIDKLYKNGLYKIYTFDVNADGIADKIISNINDDENRYQGDHLIVYLGNKYKKYQLSLETSNFTSDGVDFLYDILPRPTRNGFILGTYFSSKGYPINRYYYTFNNNDWYISKTTTQGHTPSGHNYYCIENEETLVADYTTNISTSGVDAVLANKCPLLPTKYIVTANKTEILTEGFEYRDPPNYYINGDVIEGFDQNEDWMKVSYKNDTKFGWINKRDLEPIN